MYQSINQSINQIYIAPYVTSESEARVGGVFTFTVSNVKQLCKSLESTEKFSRSTVV